jgi:hypothetical protein
MKKCSRCKETLSFDKFTKHRRYKDGYYCYCRDCHQARKRELQYNLEVSWEEFVEQHNNLCSICKQPEKLKRDGKVFRLAVDHCHTTGKTRGLLCKSCNIALGEFQDDIDRIKEAIKYLEKHNEANKTGGRD